MADVGIYLADDPEGAGISYALVTTTDADVRPAIVDDDVSVDHGKFSIDPLDGNLRFKKSPNYEKPGDDNTNNEYLVTVRATVVDDPPLTDSTDPQGPHAITRKVTVVVTNVNEAPVFLRDHGYPGDKGERRRPGERTGLQQPGICTC